MGERCNYLRHSAEEHTAQCSQLECQLQQTVVAWRDEHERLTRRMQIGDVERGSLEHNLMREISRLNKTLIRPAETEHCIESNPLGSLGNSECPALSDMNDSLRDAYAF